VESHSIPRFHGQLFFRSGEAAVSDRAPGLAEMTATMVRTGTAKRASRQIEEDLRRLGADLFFQRRTRYQRDFVWRPERICRAAPRARQRTCARGVVSRSRIRARTPPKNSKK